MLTQHHTTTIAPLFGQQTPDANGNLEWTDPGFWGRDASTLRNANAFAQAGNGSWDDFYAGSLDVNGNRGAGVNSTIQFNPGHILGQRFLPRTPRTQYSRLLGEAPATMSDADLQARWNTHNSGPDVPR